MKVDKGALAVALVALGMVGLAAGVPHSGVVLGMGLFVAFVASL